MEKLYWSSETCKADTEALNTPEKALKQLDKDLYPNIYTLLTFAATVLVTSCECERSISMLRLIKTSLRSAMTRDQSILLFFLPIFLSSNSFIFHLLCSIFCSRL